MNRPIFAVATAVVAALLTAVIASAAEPPCTISGTTGDDTLTGSAGADVPQCRHGPPARVASG